MEQLLPQLSGSSLTVNDDLRIVSISQEAEGVLGAPGASVLGRHCFDVISALDTDEACPCPERCPLVRGFSPGMWLRSRTIEVSGVNGNPARTECVQFKFLLPDGRPTGLCVVGPLGPSQAPAHSRVTQAAEAVHAVAYRSAGPRDLLGATLEALVDFTSADSAQVFLADRETGRLFPIERRGYPVGANVPDDERPSVDLAFSSGTPVLSVEQRSRTGSAGRRVHVSAPMVVEERGIGVITITGGWEDFDLATAMRVLFSSTVQVSMYLHWLYAGQARRESSLVELLPGESLRLRIHCLGAFRVNLDGKPVPASRFHRHKALTLLKLLVTHRGRPVTREALAETLWPEADPISGGNNLRVVLHALRSALRSAAGREGPHALVVSRGDLVYLGPPHLVWVDAEDFVRSAREAARLAAGGLHDEALRQCRRAIALYRGEYMEDEPYGEWHMFESERLREVYLDLLRQTATLLAAEGSVDEAIDVFRNALGVDRGREEIHRGIMYLLWQEGRRDEALRQYERCREVLSGELGVEPASETQLLYQSILEGDGGGAYHDPKTTT